MGKNAKIGVGIGLDGEKEFKSAITNINSEMKVLKSEMNKVSAEFKDNSTSVEALTSKNKVLNSQIETQKDKVETLKAALENSKKEYGENSTQTNKWQVSLNNAEADLYKLDSELKSNENALDAAKNSTDGLNDEMQDYDTQVDKSSTITTSFGDILSANLTGSAIIEGAKAIAEGIVKIGEAAIEAGKALVDMTVESSSYADEVLTMSQQTGLATDEIQKLNYASELCDVDTETLTGTMAKNIKSMTNAKKGTEDYVSAYEKLGVSVTNADGTLRNSTDVYWECIDALGGMSNETERDSVAMQLFGKSAQDINPVIMQGSEGMKALGDEAEATGYVMSNDMLSALGGCDDAIKKWDNSTQGFKNTLSVLLAPALTDVTDLATEQLNELTVSIQEADGDMEKIGASVGESIANTLLLIAEKAPEFATAATSMATELARGLEENEDELVEAGDILIDALIDIFIACYPELATIGNKMLLHLALAIVDETNTQSNKIIIALSNMLAKVGGKVIGDAKSVGKNIISGIRDGVTSEATRLATAVVKAASDALKSAKRTLGIHSPSTVFRDEVGVQMAAGVGVGWDEEMKNVNKDMAEAIDVPGINLNENVSYAQKEMENATRKGSKIQQIVIPMYVGKNKIAEAVWEGMISNDARYNVVAQF